MNAHRAARSEAARATGRRSRSLAGRRRPCSRPTSRSMDFERARRREPPEQLKWNPTEWRRPAAAAAPKWSSCAGARRGT